LAWLPAHLPHEALRRLQLAAQAQAGPVFLWRPEADAAQASPAPLRLRLRAAGPDLLALTGVKRRGPRWAEPLLLPLPAVLSARGLSVAHAWADDAAATQAQAPLSAQRLRQRASAALRMSAEAVVEPTAPTASPAP
jgi:protein ImuA